MRPPTLPLLLLALSSSSSLAGALPGVTSRILDNGLEVIVIENRTVPLVTIEIAVKSGAFVETPEFSGLSHLYEHMFFKGNRALPSQQQYMERLQELGASWNGTTGTERVNYFFTIPSANLRDGAVFMRDALLYPLFRQDELEKERVVVLGEFDRNEANPAWHLSRQVDLKLWWKYFSRKSPLGDRDTIVKATREQMLALKERYYVPNNAALLFAGDVSPDEAFALASEMFGQAAWPKAENPHRLYPVPRHPPLGQDSVLAVVQPVKATSLRVAWEGPGMLEDTPSTFAADVLSFVLDQPNSRWHKALMDSGLFDSVNLSYYSQVNTGPINVYGVTSADRLDKAYEALMQEIGKLADPDYCSDEEIAFAKDQLEFSEIYGREQTTEFVHSVSFWWATGGLNYYGSYQANLRKVTRADLQAYVRKYIQGRPKVTGLLVAEEDLGKIQLAAKAEVIRPEKGSSATAIAEQKVAEATESFTVDGVRVLLRRMPSNEVVTAKAFLDGGLAFAAEEKAGIELLMLQVAQKATRNYPKELMARELTRLGANLGSEPSPDFTTFTLQSIQRNFEPSFQIFLDALVHPTFPEDEVSLARERRLTMLGLEEQDPDSHVDRLALEAVYGTHPFALNPLGRRELIEKVQPRDLKDWHATVTRSRLLLVVAGNVSREQIERLLGPVVADLPPGHFQPLAAQPIPGMAASALKKEQSDLPTVYVEGHFPAPNVLDPDYAALYVGMSLLDNRLWDEIRTKRNLSYAPSSSLRRRSANLGRVSVSTVDPNACVQIIFDEIRKMQSAPESEAKLRNAANEIRTRFLTTLQTSDGIAGWLGEFELHGGGWRKLEEFLGSLGELTPEQVRAAMAKHVHGFDFAVFGNVAGVDEKLLTSF